MSPVGQGGRATSSAQLRGGVTFRAELENGMMATKKPAGREKSKAEPEDGVKRMALN